MRNGGAAHFVILERRKTLYVQQMAYLKQEDWSGRSISTAEYK